MKLQLELLLLLTALSAISSSAAYVLPSTFNHSLPLLSDTHTIAQRSQGPRSIKIPIERNYGNLNPDRRARHPDEVAAWALKQADYMRGKYGKKGNKSSSSSKNGAEKRQSIGLTDVGPDSYYYAQVSVGTPKQNFNIVLDTGSADFWVVDTACGRLNGCSFGLNKYDSSKSSSYVGSNAPFMIQYGSGATRGTLAAETVSLAGYTINSLTFAQADAIASGTVEPPASGIMGMGFQSLSSSGATPFWEVLVKQGKLSSNSFSFTLARNIGTVSSATATSPGGIFTLGEIDKNQYTGNINYVDIPNGLENQIGLGYWTIPMDALNVNNNNIPIGNGEATYSAIDTGTTLIGGPNAAVASLYNSIQGSQPLGGNMQGYYSFPCDADINASITFGGQAYPINSTDLNLGTIDASGQNCLGGFFEVGDIGGQGAPTWIVGDVFLKNVFSVYQYSPAAVGFASLPGNQAATESVTASAVPSGTAAASGSGSASATASSSSADGGLPLPSISRSSGTGGSGTAVQAGFTGLPAPSAASTNIATSPSNTAGSGSAGSGSSGAANVYAPAALTAGIAALGAVVALF